MSIKITIINEDVENATHFEYLGVIINNNVDYTKMLRDWLWHMPKMSKAWKDSYLLLYKLLWGSHPQ